MHYTILVFSVPTYDGTGSAETYVGTENTKTV
jgi:hypothetical protein